jgi:hypothetical protein
VANTPDTQDEAVDTAQLARHLLQATEQVLVPLVRALVGAGVQAPEVLAAVRRAYLCAIQEHLGELDLPVTPRRLQVLSGFTLSEIERTQDSMASVPPDPPPHPELEDIARLVRTWNIDPSYTLPYDIGARELPLTAPPGEPSFERLCIECAPGQQPQRVLEALLRAGAVRFDEEARRVVVTTHCFVRASDIERMGRLLGNLVRALHASAPGIDGDRHCHERGTHSQPDPQDLDHPVHARQELLEQLEAWVARCIPAPEDGGHRSGGRHLVAHPQSRGHLAPGGAPRPPQGSADLLPPG